MPHILLCSSRRSLHYTHDLSKLGRHTFYILTRTLTADTVQQQSSKDKQSACHHHHPCCMAAEAKYSSQSLLRTPRRSDTDDTHKVNW
jgi:hypothetical protein